MAAVAKLRPCGGTTGEVQKFFVHGDNRIVLIRIYYGNAAIHSLTVLYEHSGHLVTAGPWGGRGGTLGEIYLPQNEYIVSLSGHVGSINDHRVIRSLKVVTNLRTLGPYGRPEGYHFELSWNGTRIIGFHAKSGPFLNAIGVYVKVNINTTCSENRFPGGCKREKTIRCGCGRQVRLRCAPRWYSSCQCGKEIWAGCGQQVYYQCECRNLIWKGCSQPRCTQCKCGNYLDTY